MCLPEQESHDSRNITEKVMDHVGQTKRETDTMSPV